MPAARVPAPSGPMPGASWISSPTPCPRPWVKWSPWPAAAMTSRDAASTATTSAPTASAARPAACDVGDEGVDLALPVRRRAPARACGSCPSGSPRPSRRSRASGSRRRAARWRRAGGAGSRSWRRRRRSSRTTAPRRRARSIRASSSRPTSSSVRPGRSAPSAASSARAWSATAQARRSASISPSSLIARCASTARRTDASSGTVPPAAASASTARSCSSPSTVRSWDSKPSRPVPVRTAARASAGDRAAVDQHLDVGDLRRGLRGVPAVGAEQVGPVGAHAAARRWSR